MPRNLKTIVVREAEQRSTGRNAAQKPPKPAVRAGTKASTRSVTVTTQPSKKAKRPLDDEAKEKPAAAAKRRKAEPAATTAAAAAAQRTTKSQIAKADATLNRAPTQRLDVFVFGSNENGELGLGASAGSDDVVRPRLNPKLAAESVGVVQLAVGGMHCAALTYDNRILTWGVNDAGALGRDTSWDGGMVDVEDADDDGDADLNPKESAPGEVDLADVPGGTIFSQVVASDNATFVLTSTGTVFGWGTMRTNDGTTYFQEGIKIQHKPLLVPGLTRITKLAAGNNHVLALTAEGFVYTWGFGELGQLGRRPLERRRLNCLTPHKLGLRRISDIGVGADHSFALRQDGVVFAWGLNNYGQTGIEQNAGEDSANIFTATPVKSLGDVGAVACIVGGNKHTIALSTQGECFAWGQLDGFATGFALDNLPTAGLVRDGSGKPRILAAPARLAHLDAIFVAAGGDHSLAITRERQAYSWGFNTNHQTGHKQDDDVEIPTLIDNLAVRGKELIWAGAGGQFSLLAAKASPSAHGR